MLSHLKDNLSVFLADDDADDRFLFEEALLEVRKELTLTTANDGVQLMNKLNKKSCKSPYIIFLDLNMPLKNGLECLGEIKGDAQLRNIPVVIISTSTQNETINQVYKKGASYYICKPDTFHQLKILLEKVFSLNATTLNLRPTRDNFIISV